MAPKLTTVACAINDLAHERAEAVLKFMAPMLLIAAAQRSLFARLPNPVQQPHQIRRSEAVGVRQCPKRVVRRPLLKRQCFRRATDTPSPFVCFDPKQ